MRYYIFWCGQCQHNEAHAMFKGFWWRWICLGCGQRQIISL